MADERPQEHWLNAIAEYTVHAPNCPFYEDGNCECAVEEFRATLRRVLVPSNLRAATSEGKDVVVIGLERILKAVDVPDTLLSGTRSVLRRAIARLRAGTGDTPRFKRTIVCAACAMEDDDPLVCDTPGCDGQPRFVTAEWFDGRAPGTGTEDEALRQTVVDLSREVQRLQDDKRALQEALAVRGPSEGTREPAEGWATDEPTEPGWYWTRTSRGHTEILRLTEGPDGKMWADDGSWCVDEVDNEWCGPLPAPPEQGEPSDA